MALVFYSAEDWDSWSTDKRPIKDQRVQKTWYNLRNWVPVDISNNSLEGKRAPAVMKWVATNIYYDVPCMSIDVERPPNDDEIADHRATVMRQMKSIFSTEASLKAKVDAEVDTWKYSKKIKVGQVWRFFFCDEEDAILFKMSWG
jgi:hypothetical protein